MTKATRVVLVTGGMGGLGETISTKMVDAGYKVAVTYSPGNAKHGEWVAQMKAKGYDILAVPCDVADIDSCHRAVAQVQEKLGAVDVLFDESFAVVTAFVASSVDPTPPGAMFNVTVPVVPPPLRPVPAVTPVIPPIKQKSTNERISAQMRIR